MRSYLDKKLEADTRLQFRLLLFVLHNLSVHTWFETDMHFVGKKKEMSIATQCLINVTI